MYYLLFLEMRLTAAHYIIVYHITIQMIAIIFFHLSFFFLLFIFEIYIILMVAREILALNPKINYVLFHSCIFIKAV